MSEVSYKWKLKRSLESKSEERDDDRRSDNNDEATDGLGNQLYRLGV